MMIKFTMDRSLNLRQIFFLNLCTLKFANVFKGVIKGDEFEKKKKVISCTVSK